MNEISQITKHTAVGTKQASEAVAHLADLADDLRASVSTFKMPGALPTQLPGNGSAPRAARLKDTARSRQPALSGS
jgi:hypothetical protein